MKVLFIKSNRASCFRIGRYSATSHTLQNGKAFIVGGASSY
ncbi:hypothetical protein LEP1GSC052_0374 [Leptospira kmetyi serovar Malaysia str. Bejo-Iso9]|nr:hypothetical protein LEP1GSC052_0374 [Leptospira kmetyi serovar Malaysia str. Bejo-Iso9]